MVRKIPQVSAGIAFLGKDPDEQCIFYFRQHWIRLLWPAVRLMMWMIFSTVFLWMSMLIPQNISSTRHTVLLFLAATWIVVHLHFLTILYRHFLYIIIVTNRRIHRIKRTLITHDDHQTIDLRVLQDVNKCQHGPIQNLLGFGTLILEAQETVLRLHFIPRIAEKYQHILHVKESDRMGRPIRL